MKIIYKYPLGLGLNPMNLPDSSQIRSIADQRGVITMWVEVDYERKEMSRRYFDVVATGVPFHYSNGYNYLGTVLQHGGELVWHVYEVNG